MNKWIDYCTLAWVCFVHIAVTLWLIIKIGKDILK